MLLDDVASELDAEHRDLLVERLAAGGGQALITATERSTSARRRAPRGRDSGRPSPDRGPGGRRRAAAGGGRRREPAQQSALDRRRHPERSRGERAGDLAGGRAERLGIQRGRADREPGAAGARARRVVTVRCRAATWAQELDLLQGELLARLNAAIAPRRSRRFASSSATIRQTTFFNDLQVFCDG